MKQKTGHDVTRCDNIKDRMLKQTWFYYHQSQMLRLQFNSDVRTQKKSLLFCKFYKCFVSFPLIKITSSVHQADTQHRVGCLRKYFTK